MCLNANIYHTSSHSRLIPLGGVHVGWSRTGLSAFVTCGMLITKITEGPTEADAFADVEGGWDPEGGLSDDDTESEASWGDEAWNEPGA